MSTGDDGLYEVSVDPARVQLDVVHCFLSTCYWSPGVKREIVARALANSLVVGAYLRDGGAQVGYARVVTDRATFAWICDVFVLEAHRGQGLSKRMLAAILEHPELQTLRRFALATRDAHGLYQQVGFVPVAPNNWLELRPPPSVWQAEQPGPR